MTEIEIFRQIIEGLGIGALIVVTSAWLLTKAISAYQSTAKERNAIESKRLDNERADRESMYKEKATFADVTRDLGAKSQAIADTLRDVVGIIATLKDENKSAIEATKQAETNVLNTLNENHKAQTETLIAINELLTEIHILIKAKPNNEAIQAVADAVLKLENRLVNELTRIKLNESKNSLSDIPTVDVSVINANAPVSASSGNGHAPESTDVK